MDILIIEKMPHLNQTTYIIYNHKNKIFTLKRYIEEKLESPNYILKYEMFHA